jgi:hypothetical protein
MAFRQPGKLDGVICGEVVTREPLFSLTLTPEEIFGLVEFSGADEADGTEITIEYRYQHEGGPGWYAHLSEYPEEGSIPVHLPYDDHNADAAPAVAQEAAKDQIGGQGHEAAARCPLEGIASSEATCLNAGPSGRIGTDTQQGKLDADAGSTPAPPTTSPDPDDDLMRLLDARSEFWWAREAAATIRALRSQP